jgi:hypothetical protein
MEISDNCDMLQAREESKGLADYKLYMDNFFSSLD